MNGQVPYERLTKLTSLNMKCFEVNNDEELNRLTLCTNLISLDLESWPRITNEGVRGLLTALTKLRTLNLSECWGITSLTGLPLTNLHELMIAGCWQISTEEFEGLDSRTKILR